MLNMDDEFQTPQRDNPLESPDQRAARLQQQERQRAADAAEAEAVVSYLRVRQPR